jgi:hypothetical protein
MGSDMDLYFETFVDVVDVAEPPAASLLTGALLLLLLAVRGCARFDFVRKSPG